jgi:hypothetical protein
LLIGKKRGFLLEVCEALGVLQLYQFMGKYLKRDFFAVIGNLNNPKTMEYMAHH